MAQILIVEDDPSVARILVHALRNAGHSPILASDGRSALQAVQAQTEMILLDLGLPDLRGEDVLRHLRRQPAAANIPVVVISGDADGVANIAHHGTDGVAAVLRKPVAGTEVCTVVEAVLAMRTAWGTATDGQPTDRHRAKLIFRLLLQGSTPLVFQLCRLLEIERAGGRPGRGETPTWQDIARWAKRECLVDAQEAQVLLGARPTAGGAGRHLQ
jgi:CheY-like chemotaxis protein